MSHLYMITRGVKREVDMLISDLQAQYYPHNYHGKKKAVGLSIRPIQLWGVVFPETEMQPILKMLNSKVLAGRGLYPTAKIEMLRRMLKLQKIPKIEPDVKSRYFIPPYDVEKTLIGVRDDAKDEDGTELL